MDKSIYEILYFILPYLSDNGKFIECITDYNKYNMELVEKNRDKILLFVSEHFNIRKGQIRINELLSNKENQLWNHLNTIWELEVFDKLVGLLIAVGLLEDSFVTRYNSFADMKQYGEFLLREKFCFYDRESVYNYLLSIKDYVLPHYRFNVSDDMFDYMNRFSCENKNEKLKEQLLAWINTSEIKLNDNDLKTINTFLSFNLDGFFNAIVTGFDSEDGPTSLVNYLRFEPTFDYLATVNNMIASYTDSQRDDLENKKRLFLKRIEEKIKKRKLQ